MYNELLEICSNLNCTILIEEPMKNHTTMKVGGAADIFIQVNDEDSLINILSYCNNNSLSVYIIGKGSNVLVSDDGIKGVVLKLGGEFNSIKIIDDIYISCGAGVSLSALAQFALKNSLTGLEFSYGIPGSVGGALYMNAGAYNGEMKDVVVSSTHISNNNDTKQFEISSYNKEQLSLSYRHSIYAENNYVITSVLFKLQKGNFDDIKAKMNDFMQRRKDKQPLEYPSCGSTFKRPEGYFAGKLIEECGLKGKRYGGAMVSEKHSGFVINYDNATCNDILKLIDIIKKEVKSKKNIDLECEVRKLGFI